MKARAAASQGGDGVHFRLFQHDAAPASLEKRLEFNRFLLGDSGAGDEAGHAFTYQGRGVGHGPNDATLGQPALKLFDANACSHADDQLVRQRGPHVRVAQDGSHLEGFESDQNGFGRLGGGQVIRAGLNTQSFRQTLGCCHGPPGAKNLRGFQNAFCQDAAQNGLAHGAKAKDPRISPDFSIRLRNLAVCLR